MFNQITIAYGNTTLADGARDGTTGIVEALKLNGVALVQDCAFINAAWMSFIDRLVKSNTVQFRISTVHTDMVDALDFCCGIREAIPGVADLNISLGLPGGKSVTILATAAKWTPIQPVADGASSIITYNVTAGQLAITRDGGAGSPFAIPFEPHASIDPLVVPAGYAAALGAGEDGFYYGLRLAGSLKINSGARALLLALP
ncbi:MAG: hypothetical protein P4L99_21660 [Chthoniobacter sp.]|nr:hypothetical protein [Chthoniobacter sp.]